MGEPDSPCTAREALQLYSTWPYWAYRISMRVPRSGWPRHMPASWAASRAIPILGVAIALQLYSTWPYWAYEYRDARGAITHLAPLPTMLDGGSVLVFLEQPGEVRNRNATSEIRNVLGGRVGPAPQRRQIFAATTIRTQPV